MVSQEKNYLDSSVTSNLPSSLPPVIKVPAAVPDMPQGSKADAGAWSHLFI